MRGLLVLAFGIRLAAQPWIDLASPPSPALNLLNGTGEVVRPATPAAFTASLRSGSENAMSMDFAPYWLAAGSLIDRAVYKSNRVARLLAGTQFSLATMKGAQAGDPSKVAAGLVMRIWDRGDPRLDDTLADCLQRAAERALKSSAPCRDCSDEENRHREALVKNACREEARARNWNRSSWTVGGAKDTQSPAGIVWTSVAYGFEGVPGLERTSQLTAQWSRRNTGDWLGGVQLRAGGVDTHVSLEWNGSRADSRFSMTLERRVSDRLWLDVSAGGSSARRVLVASSFRWSFAGR